VIRAVPGCRRIPPAAIAGALVALAAKLLLAATTFGSTDVRSFLYFVLRNRATGPISVYEHVKEFNHPPPMIFALDAIHRWTEATGASFAFGLRLPSILADLGTFLLVASCLQPARGFARTALVLLALAPVSIFVSGFHGNTDPVMIFFVVLSVALLERSQAAWLAGAAMGLALDVKIVPLVFWPTIFLWLPEGRKRAEYFGAALFVALASWSPVLLDSPALVARRVFGYSSSYGHWGLSRLLPAAIFEGYGRFLLLGAIAGVSAWMNRGLRRPALFRQIGVVAFTFLALTPGFGVQYLAWLVPFAVALPLAAGFSFHAASGAFLLAVYTFWCQLPPGASADPDWLGASFWSRGLPWEIANANRTGPWRGELVILEVACWLAVVVAFVLQARAAAAEARGSRDGRARGSA
jgi:hypothetical protein